MTRDYIIVHHTAAWEKDAAQVRRYHVETLGWQDVGYNYIIQYDGKLVPGRPLDIPGAHCKEQGMNERSIGIALLGNFDERPPTVAQYWELVRLTRRLKGKHGINILCIRRHNEFANKSCPGRLFPWREYIETVLTSRSELREKYTKCIKKAEDAKIILGGIT